MEIQEKEFKRLRKLTELASTLSKRIERLEYEDKRWSSIKEKGIKIRAVPLREYQDFNLLEDNEARDFFYPIYVKDRNKLIAQIRDIERQIYNLQPKHD